MSFSFVCRAVVTYAPKPPRNKPSGVGSIWMFGTNAIKSAVSPYLPHLPGLRLIDSIASMAAAPAESTNRLLWAGLSSL